MRQGGPAEVYEHILLSCNRGFCSQSEHCLHRVLCEHQVRCQPVDFGARPQFCRLEYFRDIHTCQRDRAGRDTCRPNPLSDILPHACYLRGSGISFPEIFRRARGERAVPHRSFPVPCHTAGVVIPEFSHRAHSVLWAGQSLLLQDHAASGFPVDLTIDHILRLSCLGNGRNHKKVSSAANHHAKEAFTCVPRWWRRAACLFVAGSEPGASYPGHALSLHRLDAAFGRRRSGLRDRGTPGKTLQIRNRFQERTGIFNRVVHHTGNLLSRCPGGNGGTPRLSQDLLLRRQRIICPCTRDSNQAP